MRRYIPASLLIGLALALLLLSPPAGRVEAASAARAERTRAGRLAQFVEANIIATHAHQVLLAERSGKGEAVCFARGDLSDDQLQALVARQAELLKSDPASVRAWASGERSSFDPARDLEPILSSGLRVPESAPVNVFTSHLRRKARNVSPLRLRSVASLYQTVLEIDRDGDLLQAQYAAYIRLGLPVYPGQLGLAGGDPDLLAAGRGIEARTCASPYATDAAAWQIAGRKVWNWGEKHLGVRDAKVLADELLREREVRALLPLVRTLPAQRIAVVGHSFTMGQHWSSPSSFVPIVIEIFRRENPRVEFRQFAAGGLTASRALKRFYGDVAAWKPDRVLLVVMTRSEEDFDALGRMGGEFTGAGIRSYVFDRVNDPTSVDRATAERAVGVARGAGMDVIAVGDVLDTAPGRERFLSLDGVHMTEPYHRLMAKQWLRHLARQGGAGARRAGVL